MHARTPGLHEKHARRPRVADLSELFRHVSNAVFRYSSRPTKVSSTSQEQSGLQGPVGHASDLFRWPTYPDRRQLPTRNLPSSSSGGSSANTCRISLSHVKITSRLASQLSTTVETNHFQAGRPAEVGRGLKAVLWL
ncbi:hypothetical protein CORC01_10120 [Colletotrichum orchidophilum]|uniref:Uncharacterized protein n=1 Tax=Colletotrichum orchidophilum TaxID=1209926 RepID=A0A1G4AZW2_9PEZI|nr:uncharacterized protein CORC01_10120 [Colletotrichum orchidophilum]OHE94592.1 hypothetical protein CORC01_10120 [Colletotrichum orchidophilum]